MSTSQAWLDLAKRLALVLGDMDEDEYVRQRGIELLQGPESCRTALQLLGTQCAAGLVRVSDRTD